MDIARHVIRVLGRKPGASLYTRTDGSVSFLSPRHPPDIKPLFLALHGILRGRKQYPPSPTKYRGRGCCVRPAGGGGCGA